ncbi:MAG: mandelate racemase/muconate lactonizing enzyme family protein [Halobacteriota archaeon]
MNVATVEAYPVSVPVATALRNSRAGGRSTRVTETFDHVVVRVVLDDGTAGHGEVAPHPTWRGSTDQAASVRLIEHRLRPAIEGANLLRAPRLLSRVGDDGGFPFAAAGIEMALYDALGRSLAVPVYDLLGGPTGESPRLDLHRTLGIDSPEAIREAAQTAVAAGYRTFKLKVGGSDSTAEADRLRAVRESVSEANIRVDANGSWTTEEAIDRIRVLDEAAGGLELVEQPVESSDFAGLRRVREAVRPPVVVDESCHSAADVATLARADAADVVNVKLAKAGGFSGARRAVAVAAAHGLPCFPGGMAEFGVGAAANAHFAVSTPEMAYSTGVLNRYAAETLLENEAQWIPDGGRFTLPEKPGLGVDVDADAIERYRTD